MIPLPPDGVTPELLAAFVDGELDPAARAVVEQWLAEHPAAIEELQAQREMSPDNWPLWHRADPPLPSEDTWAVVRQHVADALAVAPASARQPVRGWRRLATRLVGGLTIAGSAAVIAAWALLPPVPQTKPPPTDPGRDAARRPAEPLSGVLALASDDDVEIHRVAGNASRSLVVGRAPLDGPLVLASAEDVEVEGVEPHPAWGAGGPRITTGPGDAAMIFAAPPK